MKGVTLLLCSNFEEPANNEPKIYMKTLFETWQYLDK